MYITNMNEMDEITISSSPIRQFSGTIGLLYNNEGYYDYGGEK